MEKNSRIFIYIERTSSHLKSLGNFSQEIGGKKLLYTLHDLSISVTRQLNFKLNQKFLISRSTAITSELSSINYYENKAGNSWICTSPQLSVPKFVEPTKVNKYRRNFTSCFHIFHYRCMQNSEMTWEDS